jgi:hypothetical protein
MSIIRTSGRNIAQNMLKTTVQNERRIKQRQGRIKKTAINSGGGGGGGANVLCLASSSSFTLRETRTRILVGTLRTPVTNRYQESGIVRKCNELVTKRLRRIRTAVPDPLVQVGLNPNIFGAHELRDELAHFFDCTRRLLLKSTKSQRIRKGSKRQRAANKPHKM